MQHKRAKVATVKQSRVTCPRTAAAGKWPPTREFHSLLVQAPGPSEKSEGSSPVSVTEAAASFRLSPVAQRSPGAAAPVASDWHKMDALVALYTNVVQAAASPSHARRHVRTRHAVRCALEVRLTPARDGAQAAGRCLADVDETHSAVSLRIMAMRRLPERHERASLRPPGETERHDRASLRSAPWDTCAGHLKSHARVLVIPNPMRSLSPGENCRGNPATVLARGQGAPGVQAESRFRRPARRDTLSRPGSAPPKIGRRRAVSGTGTSDADKHRPSSWDFRNFSVSACDRASPLASEQRAGLRSGACTALPSPVASGHSSVRGGGQGECGSPAWHAEGAGSSVVNAHDNDVGKESRAAASRGLRQLSHDDGDGRSLSVLDCLEMLSDIQVASLPPHQRCCSFSKIRLGLLEFSLPVSEDSRARWLSISNYGPGTWDSSSRTLALPPFHPCPVSPGSSQASTSPAQARSSQAFRRRE
jgi:hypothetical protein